MRVSKKPLTFADRSQSQRSINVLVSGFSDQSLVTIEQVTRAINALPAFHLVGLDQIIYDPKWETASALTLRESAGQLDSRAVFLKDERKVLVFGFDDWAQFQHILYHEIGHHVFARVLDGTRRKKWVMLLNPGSRHITRYAKRNAIEDFAESYATFVCDPKAMQELYRKYVFLRDEVFAGVAYNAEKGHVDISI